MGGGVRPEKGTRRAWPRVAAGALLAVLTAGRASAADAPLTELSLEQLMNLEVTSVSKSAEVLQQAPASIYVITHDDIVRSGVTSLAEALRLAPNLQITRYSSTYTVAGARGFAGAQDLQNFSNKLLILIDGRSVYTPLYSGVYLDAQDLVLDDIDRIEVISGAGATLWGANAMNGVINVITRPSSLTRGALASFGGGNAERDFQARVGGKVGDALTWRAYGKAFEREGLERQDGSDAGDEWRNVQAGFRTDWSGASDTIVAQGDIYKASEDQPVGRPGTVKGANVLARWQHRTSSGEWHLQAYYDSTERSQPNDGAGFRLSTWDVELQDRISWGINRIVWGLGTRFHDYEIDGTDTLYFEPDSRHLFLGDVFVQDTIAVLPSLDVTMGLKFERDPYSGWAPLPDVRLGWRAAPDRFFWFSASRAIRSPTPFDTDVREVLGGTLFLVGNHDFKTEKVVAYEIGHRAQIGSRLSVSVSGFMNDYDDLRTIEFGSPETPIPLVFRNLMKGRTYGVEAWGKWQALRWWRLSPGARWMKKDLRAKEGSFEILGAEQAANDPESQAMLTSSMELSHGVVFDTTLSWVAHLPNPHRSDRWNLQASLGWQVTPRMDISVSGFDLLESRHREYPAPSGEFISRSAVARVRVKF